MLHVNGNRFTKVNMLPSDFLFFVFRNDLYENLFYYMYARCNTKMKLKV